MDCNGYPECFALGCGCEDEPDVLQECEECGEKKETTKTKIGASVFAICDDCQERWTAQAERMEARRDAQRFGDDTFVVRHGR